MEPLGPTPSVLIAVHAALRMGDAATALRLAHDALDRGHAHALLFDLRARASQHGGHPAQALADLDRAEALEPNNPDRLTARAQLLATLGRGREGLAALQAAADLRPDDALSWRTLAMAQIAQGEVLGARDALLRAMALDPADPEPPGQLAVLAARRADWVEASRLAHLALALAPAHPGATRALAEAELAAGQAAAAADRLDAWLKRPGAAPPARRLALGLLGDVRERQGRYADAFALYAQGNAETRRRHAQGVGRSDLAAVLRRLQAEVSALGSWEGVPPAADASPATGHVFLMGFMRSGTTLLEQALAARDDVVTLEEQEALGLGVTRFLGSAGGLARLRDASPPELARHRADYWARVRACGVEPKGKVFIDKNPFSGVKLPLILRLFPEAKIVFSLRHPADVVLSCFKHRFAVTSYTYPLLDLQSAARFYDAYMSLVRTYMEALTIGPLVYRHEDLVDDFEGVVSAVCRHIGLDWRESMRDVGAGVREGRVSSPSAMQLRDGLSRAGLQGWRRYAVELEPISPYLAPWISRLNYGDAEA